MIEVDKDIKVGDRVFMWYSIAPIPIKNQISGKPPVPEVEYTVTDMNERFIRVRSISGSYTMLFFTDMLKTWHGRFRKKT